MKIRTYLISSLIVFFLLLLSFPVSSKIIYVDADVTNGNQDGTSWENSYSFLQFAISEAVYGDTIWVAEGTYKPTNSSFRTISFSLNNGVKWFGGFQGNETELSQRDYELYPTILSGDIGVQGDSTDNSYHIIYSMDADSTTIMDGFQITKGQADFGYWNDSKSYGGGLLIDGTTDNTSLQIKNCHFSKNYALFGGAVNCSTLNPTFDNCQFTDNVVEVEGGAIWKSGHSIDSSEPFISNCFFEKNIGRGGAVFFDNVTGFHKIVDSDFYENRIADNSSGVGGSIAFDGNLTSENSNLEIEGCHFEGGKAGHGTSIFYGTMFNNSETLFNFKINDCVFIGSQGSGWVVSSMNHGNCSVNLIIENADFIQNGLDTIGGVIFLQNSSEGIYNANIDKCTFLENGFQAWPLNSVINNQADSLKISNSVFAENYQRILNSKGDVDIINTTFHKNGNKIIWKDWDKEMNIVNCIFWEDLILEQVFSNVSGFLTDTTKAMLGFNIKNTLLKNDNCFFNGIDYCGDGMLYNLYPEFRDTMNNDFSLRSCSPAINQGENISIDSLDIFFDIEGNPRILDDAVDLGAYETQAFEVLVPQAQNVQCHSGADGAITWVQHGTPPFTFEWDNGVTTGTAFTGLSVGNYSIAVMDADNCLDTFNMTVNQPLPLEIIDTITAATGAMVADGMIEVMLTGGVPNYEYLWSNGDTTALVENLLPGIYTITVTDANDCEEVVEMEVGFMTAVNQLDEKYSIRLIPNLMEQGGTTQLVFDLTENVQFEIEGFNEIGQFLFSKKIEMSAGENTYELPVMKERGLFFVKVKEEKGGSKILKWIVL